MSKVTSEAKVAAAGIIIGLFLLYLGILCGRFASHAVQFVMEGNVHEAGRYTGDAVVTFLGFLTALVVALIFTRK